MHANAGLVAILALIVPGGPGFFERRQT
jgi:hypothetical protein